MTEWWQASDAELLVALGESSRELNAAYLDVLDVLEVVGEVTARGLGGKEGFVTDVELVRCTQNVTRPEAKRRLAAARDVLPGRTASGEVTPHPGRGHRRRGPPPPGLRRPGRHHTLIHTTDWAVTITDGLPTFHPPAWIPGGPRRNPLHRIDLLPTANCGSGNTSHSDPRSALHSILRP
ncbi:MAG: hypothetical protein ACRDRH_11785 [Pseudonocardia sp.]